MERPSFLRRSKSDSFSSIHSSKDEKYLLPLSVQKQPKIRVVRALLGHCLYRRVILWTVAVLFLLCLTLFSGVNVRHKRILDLVDFRKSKQQDGRETEQFLQLLNDAIEKPAAQEEEEINLPSWLRFRHLDGYYNGLKALVSSPEYIPEFPRAKDEKSPFPLTIAYSGLPTPTPYIPQPRYGSLEYTNKYHEVNTCYLDKDKTIPAPDLYAYNGVIQGQPEPVIGSYDIFGFRKDVCFDRFGRYGPYGLGYSFEEGGVEMGMDTEKEGSQEVWHKTGKINYDRVDWGDAQDWCYESNKKRFTDTEGDYAATRTAHTPLSTPDPETERLRSTPPLKRETISRTAIVVRTYVGFQWTQHAILNFRGMISELSLRSGGEYAVHFLLHVRDDDEPIWADPETTQRILDESVPYEFQSICTLWSEAQMRLLYPGRFGSSVENPSSDDIHGVYRSAHMPLQHFAMTHPQYAHFWNWEMDMRWVGNYYELFDRLGIWAKKQSRVEIWERSQKYYIPHYHGSWENFTQLVHKEVEASVRPTILGPLTFPGRTLLRAEERGEHFMPRSCSHGTDPAKCGVGEDADLITLNPLFDTEESGWVFAQDVTGYNPAYPTPPRRCAIVTASRLSRRLLQIMYEETWRLHHSMFSEMFPASMALHHGLKAVYAPHPVYLDREWDIEAIDKAFNGGRDHSTSSHGSPFDLQNEHNHKGSTWYYNSEFAGLLWRRWLGYAQMDGRGENGGRSGQGTLRGGREEEENPAGTGRMCLRSMLVHPIKWEHPDE
ncbi:hypothetical protein B0T22DRAFT_231838 [Podospora appendiculata]|uniref:Uncharacterized protein n=1 Tax=Podospora appendiculata TaxID=314037 RepID=A0AAE0X613_9PEZI|nr:hypothetical protein B0T22DRAFT_231838 [Podospora appendiculata]